MSFASSSSKRNYRGVDEDGRKEDSLACHWSPLRVRWI